MKELKPKLLLHVCCAPCATEVIQRLKKDYLLTLFFSNSNIHPEEEYILRLNNAKIIADGLNIELAEDDYEPEKWEDFVSKIKNHETLPEGEERCTQCFTFRLEQTARFAKEFNFDIFATTLTISPYKSHVLINKIGSELSKKHNIKFLDADFKKQDGFKKSIELSRKYNLYRQKYCGCRYSIL